MSLVALLLLAHVSAAPSTEAEDLDPPAYVYLTWARDDTAHSINISWRTMTQGYLGEVRYDTEPRDGDPGLYRYQAAGDSNITPVTYSGLRGYVHHIELTGVSANTTYYFTCGHPDYGWSEERSFRTAPETSADIRFVVGGDSRTGAPDWPEGRDNISSAMAKFNPSFVIFAGDFIDDWNDQQEWDNWFAAAGMYWIDTGGLTIPIIPAIGNHDVRTLDYDPQTDATNYYQQFNLPGNERWYALSWGPDLRVMVLDLEISEGSVAYQEQLDWLENELIASEDYPWKIVVLHRDMVSFRGPVQSLVRDLAFYFDKYHVDLVLTSHFHAYERSHPLNWTTAPEEIVSPEEGTIYIVSGGWGAPLYTGENAWFSAFGPESRYHFVLIDVFEDGMLHLQAVGVDGETFDEYPPEKVPEGQGVPIGAISAVVVVVAIGALFFLKWRRSRMGTHHIAFSP